MKVVILVILLIIIFAISFALGQNNHQLVEFNYLLAKSDLRLSTLLAIVLVTGFLLGWLLTGFFFLRAKLKLAATTRKLKKIQKMYDDEFAKRQHSELTSLPANK